MILRARKAVKYSLHPAMFLTMGYATIIGIECRSGIGCDRCYYITAENGNEIIII